MKVHALLREDWALIERLLMPQNALIIEICLRYGLRIGDTLRFTRINVEKGSFTFKEEKTGKNRRIKLSPKMRLRILAQSGEIWAFEHRLDVAKHKTRQAVWKDLKRACEALRITENVGTHSARKTFACEFIENNKGDAKKLQEYFKHSNLETTLLYVLDKVT